MLQAVPTLPSNATLAEPIPPDKALELEPQLVRQTQLELRRTVAEIAELAKQPLSLNQFLTAFLPRVASSMLAIGVAVWRSQERWELAGEHRFPGSLLSPRSNAENTSSHSDLAPSLPHELLLNRVSKGNQPVLIPPGSNPQSSNDRMANQDGGNPSSYLLIFAPASIEGCDETYWLEVAMEPIGGPATLRGYLRFAAQMADRIAEHLRCARLRNLEYEQSVNRLTSKLLEFLAGKPSLAIALRCWMDTARTICSADQAMLAVRDRDHDWRIVAGSGLDAIDSKGSGHQSLVLLANALSPAREQEIACVTSENSSTHDLHRALDHLAAKRVDVVRIYASAIDPNANISILFLWSQPVGLGADTKIHSLSRLALEAIQPPWWQAMKLRDQATGPWSNFLRPSTWSNFTKRVLFALFVIAILMVPVPSKFTAMATLQPAAMQQIYAPTSGTIRGMTRDHGDAIAQGQVILEIEDPQLMKQLDDVQSDLIQIKHRLTEVASALKRGQLSNAIERDQLESEQQALEHQRRLADERLQILETHLSATVIRSQLDGMIGTWNAKARLSDRPVVSGQPLLSIYDPNGPWYVEASIDEHLLSELDHAVRHGYAGAASVYLASHPWKRVIASFHSLDPHAFAEPNSGRTQLLVRFAVSAGDLPLRHQGAMARIQVPVGHRPIGWILFGDLISSLWIKARMWI